MPFLIIWPGEWEWEKHKFYFFTEWKKWLWTRISTEWTAMWGCQGMGVPPALSGVGSLISELRLPMPWLHRGHLCWWGALIRMCVCVCMIVCVLLEHALWVCFSNANLTRGLCVAAMARPTSTTVSFIEMPASLDPKSRLITTDTAKVGSALTTVSQLVMGARELSSVVWMPGVLPTPMTAPYGVENTQVLGGVSSWCSWVCWVCPGCPRPLPRLSCIRYPQGGF